MALARWTGLVQDGNGNAVAGAQVEVRRESDNSLVALFSDANGTAALGNPFTAAEATVFFHVAGGAYRVKASVGAFEQIWRYVGIGTAGQLDIEDAINGARYDVMVSTMADRAAYNAEGALFAVLVADVGNTFGAANAGRSAIFAKKSATSGDWTDPAYMTGPVFAFEAGTTTTGPAGSDASFSITPTAQGGKLNLTLPRGAAGGQGAAGIDGRDPGILLIWSTNTADSDPTDGIVKASNADLSAAAFLYVDNVNRAGSSLVNFLDRLDDSTSPIKGEIVLTRVSDNAQAIFSVVSAVAASGYFKVGVTGHSGATAFGNGQPVSFQFTRTGNAGSGDGDVKGPASSISGRIAVFSNATGKQLEQASVAIADLQPADTDLTAIAALITTTYGRALLTLASQGALMALISLSSATAAGIIEQATAGEVRSGLADRAIAPDVAQAAMAWVAGPADASTMTFDQAAGVNQTATATAARTITASNLKNGLPLTIVFTGNFAHTYDTAAFDFTEVGGVPISPLWSVYLISGVVRSGKVRVHTVAETGA
ncbi:carboxypeptidase-like regulatory domain-containing protein [Devosia aurantiaca]|uniref:Carboxypeptidase regulatory-like domain-containing protein n=1 Tax=Devosia aurantiaca TaxID=2714858 RepID=A0A6M1SHI9_9HYPH|nr:carboxypeptidase-like regulatory domain-containing protein [Devosia aurantiaca]NGP19289.1 carboxypeptidase regulatory-like domain-containing protein [Devosia aurantiaca]